MKVETCVTISEDLLQQIDEFAKDDCSRSEFVEEALRRYLSHKQWRKKHEMTAEEEKAIINRYTEENREEIRENLRFQAELMLEALDETR